ncbi:MAG: hypothetical protein ACXAC8_12220 [Candidatus Hodarchaeales archaeon]|jgi:hypothetical protein
MAFNLKNLTIGASLAAVLAILVLTIALIALNLENGNLPPDPAPKKGIGYKIATRVRNSMNDVDLVWSVNNSFVNNNLSASYGKFVDAVSISKNNVTIINEPLANTAEIEQVTLNNVMEEFYDAVSTLNETSETIDDIDDFFPPTLLLAISYENGSSISLIFSKEAKVVGVVNGTWTLSEHTHHGAKLPIFDYSLHDAVYLSINDLDPLSSAISGFENFIKDAFPL